jgi:hypothetical protein
MKVMMSELNLEMLEAKAEKISNQLQALEDVMDRFDLFTKGDEVDIALTDLRDELKDLHDMIYESRL